VLAFYLETGTLRSESSGAVISPAAIGRVIFSLILRRLEVAAISSSAHADQICGGQTPCFLLARLHGLPMALLKETKRQHAFVPLPRIILAIVRRGYAGAKYSTQHLRLTVAEGQHRRTNPP
jgi:hypothetical protein